MKLAGPTLIVAATVLFSTTVRCQDVAPTASDKDAVSTASDMPYASIVARNMFGLLPIPKVDPTANQPPADPPPKITLNGIMTIFGKDQALFKVANKPKPGQPAKDDAHVLAEGEMEDDITVVTIDHLNGKVTFNNHGETQELALVPAKDTGGPATGPGGPGQRTIPGSFPQPGFTPGGGRPGFGAFPRPPAPGNSNPSAGVSAGAANNGGLSFGGEVNDRGVYQPTADTSMTPEQKAILMEAQRDQYIQSGNSHLANMIPPTKYTEQLNPSGQQ